MDVETLRKILEKLPDDFDVVVRHMDLEVPVRDSVEINVAAKKLVLK